MKQKIIIALTAVVLTGGAFVAKQYLSSSSSTYLTASQAPQADAQSTTQTQPAETAQQPAPQSPTQTPTSNTPTPTSGTPELTRVFKNGTYSADGAYVSPGGPQTIGITLTIKDDMVTAASARVEATGGKSAFFQNKFADNFTAMVVGQKLSSLSLSNVAGSSLTPQGFNDAVSQIETQAKG